MLQRKGYIGATAEKRGRSTALKKYRSTAEEGVYRSNSREEKEYCSSSIAKMRSRGVAIQQGRVVEDIEEGVIQQ